MRLIEYARGMGEIRAFRESIYRHDSGKWFSSLLNDVTWFIGVNSHYYAATRLYVTVHLSQVSIASACTFECCPLKYI